MPPKRSVRNKSAAGNKKRKAADAADHDGSPPKKKVYKYYCKAENCTNQAKVGGVCVRHGAKQKRCRCSVDGCKNQAVNGGVCYEHGATRKLCRVPDCTNYPQGRGGLCIRHGAPRKPRKLCRVPGCTSQGRQKGGVCGRHRYYIPPPKGNNNMLCGVIEDGGNQRNASTMVEISDNEEGGNDGNEPPITARTRRQKKNVANQAKSKSSTKFNSVGNKLEQDNSKSKDSAVNSDDDSESDESSDASDESWDNSMEDNSEYDLPAVKPRQGRSRRCKNVKNRKAPHDVARQAKRGSSANNNSVANGLDKVADSKDSDNSDNDYDFNKSSDGSDESWKDDSEDDSSEVKPRQGRSRRYKNVNDRKAPNVAPFDNGDDGKGGGHFETEVNDEDFDLNDSREEEASNVASAKDDDDVEGGMDEMEEGGNDNLAENNHFEFDAGYDNGDEFSESHVVPDEIVAASPSGNEIHRDVEFQRLNNEATAVAANKSTMLPTVTFPTQAGNEKKRKAADAADPDGSPPEKKVYRYYCNAKNCTNTAQKGGVCKRHGAKVHRCSFEKCENQAVNGGVCYRHGAKRERILCSKDGCKNRAINGGVCRRHGANLKPRKLCRVPGCTSQGCLKGGVCERHKNYAAPPQGNNNMLCGFIEDGGNQRNVSAVVEISDNEKDDGNESPIASGKRKANNMTDQTERESKIGNNATVDELEQHAAKAKGSTDNSNYDDPEKSSVDGGGDNFKDDAEEDPSGIGLQKNKVEGEKSVNDNEEEKEAADVAPIYDGDDGKGGGRHSEKEGNDEDVYLNDVRENEGIDAALTYNDDKEEEEGGEEGEGGIDETKKDNEDYLMSPKRSVRNKSAADNQKRKADDAADHDGSPPKKRVNKRCSAKDCTNKAQVGGVCIRHGAILKKCRVRVCKNYPQGAGGVCRRHGAPRKPCSVKDCENHAKVGGVCIRHGAPRKLCRFPNCTNWVVKGGVCKRHRNYAAPPQGNNNMLCEIIEDVGIQRNVSAVVETSDNEEGGNDGNESPIATRTRKRSAKLAKQTERRLSIEDNAAVDEIGQQVSESKDTADNSNHDDPQKSSVDKRGGNLKDDTEGDPSEIELQKEEAEEGESENNNEEDEEAPNVEPVDEGDDGEGGRGHFEMEGNQEHSTLNDVRKNEGIDVALTNNDDKKEDEGGGMSEMEKDHEDNMADNNHYEFDAGYDNGDIFSESHVVPEEIVAAGSSDSGNEIDRDAEIERLNTELEKVRKGNDEQLQNLSEKLESAKYQLQIKHGHIQCLRNDLANKSIEIEEKLQEIEDMNADKADLEIKLTKAATARLEERAGREKERADKETAYMRLANMTRKFRAYVSFWTDKVDRTDSRVTGIEARLKEKSDAVTKLRGEVEKVKAEREQLEAKVQIAVEETGKLRSKVEELTEHLRDMKERFEESFWNAWRKEKEMRKLEAANVKLSGQVRDLKRENATLKSQVEKEKIVGMRANGRAHAAMLMAASHQDKEDESKAKIEDLEAELVQQKREMTAELEAFKSRSRSDYEELESEMNDLLRQLQNQFTDKDEILQGVHDQLDEAFDRLLKPSPSPSPNGQRAGEERGVANSETSRNNLGHQLCDPPMTGVSHSSVGKSQRRGRKQSRSKGMGMGVLSNLE